MNYNLKKNIFPTALTTLTLDTEKIESLILNGYNEKAAESIFEIIENYENHSDKELIYRSLSLLNLICDKAPSISLRAINNINHFINDSDSWIRLVSLEISYQISLFRPNLLIELINKIRGRLYDQDSSVRRLTVKIIGNLILSLHIDLSELQEIIEEYTEKLMDNDWKVKLNVIKTIQKILNQDYTKIPDLEPLLSMVIINLRDEDDDVARAAAELLKIHGTYFLSKEKIFYILLNLLYNEENRVKELIIWLFGEIGKEKSSEIISIIPKLINLLKEKDYRIQLKVIEALVNIAENNFDQIWANLLHSILEASDSDYRNSLINAIFHLSSKNIPEIFPYLFEELENPSENIREGIVLVFKRLFEEYQIEIENEITKILYQLESRFWRERKKTIVLLQNICFILESKKLAVWITIELNNALKIEKDPEVKKEIIYTLKNIKANFPDIDNTIERINNELTIFRKRIIEFQKIPAQFREKLNSYIQNFKFNTTEIQLNEKYNKILKKVKKFHQIINRFEYKRLAFDLIEDWEETRVQIIEELSIIKGFISEICEEKKAEFTLDLKKKINIIIDRINILKTEFEYMKENKFEVDLDTQITSIELKDIKDDTLGYITQIRKKLFKLDGDIRELLINNVEFNEIFKDLLQKWVATKIEIQEYLNDLDRQIKLMKDKLFNYILQAEPMTIGSESKLIDGISTELSFQLLQGHIQSIITEKIEGMKNFNEDFHKLINKFDFLIKKNEFSDAKRLIEINTMQIQNYIEDAEKKIDIILGKEKIFEDNNIFNLYIRPYLNKFNASKELIINKSKTFVRKSNNKLYLNQIKYYLKIINPIKLDLLANYIKLDIERVKELVLKFINKNKLNAKIINDKLYFQQIDSEIPDSKEILFFKNIKTIGNEIYLNFKLTNPSNFDFKDLQISLKVPSYLIFQRKESFPKFLQINELKPGKIFKFNYVLKVDKQKELKKNLFDPTADEIKLELYYRDQFEIARKMTKHIDLYFP
ncbi:MAG: HEAT repeat domain-containing protein [Promethearchaeota archaeon]